MIYTIFEDNRAENLYPFTLNHSVVEIRYGAFTIIERFQDLLNDGDKIILIVRDSIKDIVAERHPNISVNPEIIPPSQYINSAQLELTLRGTCIEEEVSLSDFNPPSNDLPLQFMWNYLANNRSLLSKDRKNFSMSIEGDCAPSCVFVKKDNIHISSSAKISAGVILDGTDGPIIIDDDVFIDIGVLIKGPTYIGKNSTINIGAKLRGGISIGPYCKIGGEIEDTTFHGYSNKQHDGYLGHSYVGEWVNLGANTNNSDLKNNYSNVKFRIGDHEIDTDEIFLGCMIGDYTKTGISTMINTGTYIGLGCNLFGGEFQDKQIPSFTWGREDRMELDKFLQTLNLVKKRRDKSITEAEAIMIEIFYKNSEKLNI